MLKMSDITITSLETITAFDVVTGAYKFTLDELQDATIQNTQDKQDITGKGGRKLSSIKRNKAVTISGNNGLLSGGLLELQTGSEFENKATSVMWTDYLTVSSNEATGSYVAIGTTGAEIIELYIKNANGTLGDSLVQDSSASAGKFAYNPSTKKFTFSGLDDGTEVIAYYNRNITADVLDNESDVFSGKATLYIDAIGEDKCANIYRVQFFIPKADFNGEFEISMGDNQVVHAFEAESLAGSCGNGSKLWSLTIFGENAADTPVTGVTGTT